MYSLGSSKEAGFGEQLLNAWLEYGFGLEVVHARGLGLSLERGLRVAREADDVGLGQPRGYVFVEKLPYLDGCFEAIANRHKVVHQNQRVCAIVLLEASLDEVQGLTAI